MENFTKHKFTSTEIKTIFFPKSPRKCQTCKKIQTRKRLSPVLFPDGLKDNICMCSQSKKKSKEKKQKDPQHENSYEQDFPYLNDSQNINGLVQSSQNHGDLNNNANEFVTRQEFESCVKRLENDISELKNDVSGIKNDISGLKNDISELKNIWNQK